MDFDVFFQLGTLLVSNGFTWIISRARNKAEVRRVQLENEDVRIKSIQQEVEIYRGVIEDLKREITRLKEEVQELRNARN